MYLKMYFKCPVTFQENTCILIFCMYFTRIPNESKIHFGIHIRYIKIHVSWALPWCHTGYISRYIRRRVSWTLHHDTSRYIKVHMRDTYGIHSEIHTSWMYPERYVSEMQDTCGIHARYMYLQGWSRYIWDTFEIHDEIHVSQMHLEREVSDMKETCGIHARYMRDTCILRGNQDTCGIHAEYMRNTCGIHARYMRDTYLGGLGVSKRGRK
jgi:hypothetical protein